jgi:hypothetical protein
MSTRALPQEDRDGHARDVEPAEPVLEHVARAQLVHHLEPDQLVAETFRPVPRARLSKRATIALWALRVFVVIVGLMVIYAFIAELH